MRVCAHINLGPWSHDNRRFDSITDALAWFRRDVIDSQFVDSSSLSDDERDGYFVIDIYPEIDENGDACQCDSACNFHDYPYARYGIGPRGGLRKIYV